MTIRELIDSYGLSHISEKTRISTDNLLNLLNEDFDALSKANALGFLKIIEREFEVDLSEPKARIKEFMKDDTYVPKELLLTETQYGVGKKFTSGIVIFIVLLAGLGYTVYLLNNQNGTNIQEQPSQTSVQEIEAIEPQPVYEAIFQDVNETNQTQETKTVDQEPMQPKQPQVAAATQEIQTAQKEVNAEVNDANQTQEQSNEQTVETAKTVEVFDAIQSVVIEPRQKLWLGYINLSTGERVQKNKIEPIVIDQNNTIIVTGHGWLEVAQKKFNQGDRLYFHFVDNRLHRINEAAFKELNKGRIW
jgi:cytoskeletal protein RodZ